MPVSSHISLSAASRSVSPISERLKRSRRVAESRVVTPADGGFFVRNGPFMRSFLDGYYPMHVTLEVVLPPGEWQLFSTRPASQPGFEVQYRAGMVRADAWFSGMLRTEFHFLPGM